jgi:UDP-glucose 4-epimerase
MKLLITGGAGYIGSVLVAKLIEEGHAVNVLDDLSSGHKNNVHPKAILFNGSILDAKSVNASMVGCQAVIHLAAKSLVGESVTKSDLYWKTNVEGTKNIIESMITNNITNLIFSSTCAVYEQSSNPLNESSPLGPNSPYGETKLLADKEIEKYAQIRKINAVILRFFNVAGSYDSPNFKTLNENHVPETHLIPNLMDSTDIDLYGIDWETRDGTCIRDYFYVGDLADCIIRILGSKQFPQYEIYNIGSGTGVSVLEVIELFKSVKNISIKYSIRPRREGDVRQLIADPTKIFATYNWKASTNLKEIINSLPK